MRSLLVIALSTGVFVSLVLQLANRSYAGAGAGFPPCSGCSVECSWRNPSVGIFCYEGEEDDGCRHHFGNCGPECWCGEDPDMKGYCRCTDEEL